MKVSTVQTSLNFGGLPFGATGPDITPVGELPSFNGAVEIKDAPADAVLLANISGATDHFFVRDIYVLDWTETSVGGGDLLRPSRAPRVKVLEVVNFSDGKTPVAVKQHQFVLVRVSYAAGWVGGAFSANLTIKSDTWEDVVIPLSLFVADVQTIASSTLNIIQGRSASLPFIVSSIAGPDLPDLHFEMSPTQLDTGLTLSPNHTSLLAGETKTVLLNFTADANAPVGSQEVALDQFAFRRRGFFFTALVHAAIAVNPLVPDKIVVPRRGVPVTIPIIVDLKGEPSLNITFTPLGVPDGVSVESRSLSMQQNDTVELKMLAGSGVEDEFSFAIVWTTSLGIGGVMNFSVTIAEPEIFLLRSEIVTDTGDPVGGWTEMLLKSNGDYTFRGSVRATGFPSYHFGLLVSIRTGDGVVLTAFHSGRIFGTDTPGPRDNGWEENLHNDLIKTLWPAIKIQHDIGYDFKANIAGVLGTAWDIVKAGLEGLVGYMTAGTIGAGIVLGSELAAASGLPSPPGVVAGIAVVGGSVVIFGPGVILPATVAGAVAGTVLELAIKTRPIREKERDFARLIFGNTLEQAFENNRVWITNLSHGGGRKYTIPNLDGSILLNLNDAFDDPINNSNPDYPNPGEAFAHELTHACQIAANQFFPGLICGEGDYDYYPKDETRLKDNGSAWAQRSWTDFKREQQGHIVNDWYGAFCNQLDDNPKPFNNDLETLKNNLNSQKALQDPAFPFILKCRAGIF